MKKYLANLLALLAMLLVFLAGSVWSRGRVAQGDVEAPPLAYAWGQQLTVYYPAQKKLFVYSELGGHCVYAYTLSTPGGPIMRENCK